MTIEPAITIAEFTKRYDAARERLTDFVYDLAEAQLSKTHDAAGWAVKDHLIHLAVWQNGMTALLRGQPRFAAMGVSDAQGKSSDYDTTNDIIFKQHRHLSSGEAMEMFDKADTEFWEVFETLSDADLIKPYAHFAPSAPDTQEPVIGWLVGNTFGHFDEHLPWMRDIAARRINVTTGTRWEEEVGYCRAVRIGIVAEVAGTVAADDAGNVVGGNDAYLQAAYIFSKIERALGAVGMSMRDVIRTRMYVTDIAHWPEIGRAHGEVFRDVKPASTLIQVKGLISPEYVVEIEASAVAQPN
ncbi:MAG TPA: Rid family hydrolase [Thermoflexales bacterium]|nr:Rid family hydrolase [Thermoflexales bacterium]HQZ99422.1 Rid family hydrolase [Thermoflexales bacterium]